VKKAIENDLTRFVTITISGRDKRKLIRADNSFKFVMRRFNNWREYIHREFKVKI